MYSRSHVNISVNIVFISYLTRLYFPEEFRIFRYFPVVPSRTTFPYATRKRERSKNNAKLISYLPAINLIYTRVSYIGLT